MSDDVEQRLASLELQVNALNEHATKVFESIEQRLIALEKAMDAEEKGDDT